MSQTNFRRAFIASMAAPVIGAAACQSVATAAPTGTRPTVLNSLSVISISSTKMRVSGRLATLTGSGLAGMRIDIYSVSASNLTRWATVYTGNDGNFSIDTNKVSVGRSIQVCVEGSGAYNPPLPTFPRP